MESTKVDKSIIGKEIGEPIYSANGNMLMNGGMVVNNKVLEKLMSHNVDFVYVVDSLQTGIDKVETIDTGRMEESICAVKNVFESVMNHNELGVKNLIPPDRLNLVKDIISMLLAELEKYEDILFIVSDLIKSDEYTYKHSVNVAILSILTAKKMNYSKLEIKNVALGALLHDIGKVRVDTNLIQKPSKLEVDERILVERHAELGYELVKDIQGLPFATKQIIRLHHEKMDGTGYPLGLTNIEIPEYVRIVTVCDMFDAMTSDRIYRKKMPTYRALDILMAEAIYKIDREIYRLMTNTISLYSPGIGVVLSDGRIGVVSSYRKHNPSRPRVRVMNKGINNKFVPLEEVDLEKVNNVFIDAIWDINDLKELESIHQEYIDKGLVCNCCGQTIKSENKIG